MKLFHAKTLVIGDRPMIKEVEVERFTEKSIWKNGSRWGRFTENYGYFETQSEAVDFIQNYFTRKRDTAYQNYERQQKIFLDVMDNLSQYGEYSEDDAK